MLQNFLLAFIRLYQKTLSPNKGRFRHILANKICLHHPHCSEYGYECIEKYGTWTWLQYTTTRVLSCTGWTTMRYDPSSYRVVFFGSSSISVPFLEWLYQDPRFEIVWVVTMPDQPSGRGMKLQPNIVKQKVINHQIWIDWKQEKDNQEAIVVTPESLRLDSKKYGKQAQKFKKRIEEIQPDLCVVVAYGNIIPQWLLDIPYFWCINVHGSLLPKYRGASPLQDIFLHKEKETGLTIMEMDVWVDTGAMIDTIKTNIHHAWTVKDLILWIEKHGPNFLNKTLRSYLKGEVKAIAQDTNKATYCSKISKEDGLINIYDNSLDTIYNKRRAYYLWPKTYFIWERKNGKKIQVIIEEMQIKENNRRQDHFIYQKNGNWALHADIIELYVKPEGKSKISWDTFVQGY